MKKNQLIVLPFPDSEQSSKRIDQIASILDGRDTTLMVRRVRLQDYQGNSRSLIRIYHQGKMLANYGYKISAV